MSEPETGSDASPSAIPAGIALEPVTDWLSARVADVEPPLGVELIAGGHSNLTFRLTDAGGRRWVLRRPPLKQVLATAHDMGREHRIIEALAPSPVPVPTLVGLCDDEAVNGAPFYVMDFVDGTVVRDQALAATFAVDERARMGASLVDTLAAIHAVDVDAVGLGTLGKKEDYLARQLKRWSTQFERSTSREIPEIVDVHARLEAERPEQQRATLVHGDYRLDNCIVGAGGAVAAVLDWELCTLGDPLADLGMLFVYMPDPDDEALAAIPAPTAIEGFPRKREILERYGQLSDLDLGAIAYYEAFGMWKLACIAEGVFARYQGGAMGDRGTRGEGFGEDVIALARSAQRILDERT